VKHRVRNTAAVHGAGMPSSFGGVAAAMICVLTHDGSRERPDCSRVAGTDGHATGNRLQGQHRRGRLGCCGLIQIAKTTRGPEPQGVSRWLATLPPTSGSACGWRAAPAFCDFGSVFANVLPGLPPAASACVGRAAGVLRG